MLEPKHFYVSASLRRGSTGKGTMAARTQLGRLLAAHVVVAATLLSGSLGSAAGLQGRAIAGSRPTSVRSSLRWTGSTALARYGSLPLAFEANRGQTDSRVKFFARGRGYLLFLTVTDAVAASSSLATGYVDLHFAGANPRPRVVGLKRLPGRVNYFIGNDPKRWHSNIATYARVVYRDVYHDINLVYYGREGQLEYDWVLRPGARVGEIRVQVRGTGTPRIDRAGNLLLSSGRSVIRQNKPVVYQMIRGVRRFIPVRYVLGVEHEVGFAVGRFDARESLVIDPTLIYSTYLGGSDSDGAFSIAVDSTGHAYITGDTMSPNFPTAHPLQGVLRSDRSCADASARPGGRCTDAFVSKLGADGRSLVYSTFLGGTRDDSGHAIAVDKRGNAYVTGNTLSPDFPVRNALQPHFGGGSDLGDAFVSKLNASGSALIYSTYLGGKGDDDGNAIAVEAGNVYVAGRTNSANFPTAHPFQSRLGGGVCRYEFLSRGQAPCFDAFVAKLSTSGSKLVYSTYLGGKGTDFAWGIAVHQGRAYVAGQTASTNFPTAHALQRSFAGGTCSGDACDDAFLTELSSAGNSLIYSTYLGGSDDDIANGVVVDSSGNAYLVGVTQSANFPIVHAAEGRFLGRPDVAFVTKVAAGGKRLIFSTYLGGSGSDEGYGIALDSAHNVYVTGRTSSPNFPTVRPLQNKLPGKESPQNAFVTELSASGSSFVYSTYLGGNDHDLGGGIAVDSAGNAYITGFATSTDFPTVHPLQSELGGGTFDAFVAKIGDPNAKAAAPISMKRGPCRRGFTRVHGTCRRTQRKP